MQTTKTQINSTAALLAVSLFTLLIIVSMLLIQLHAQVINTLDNLVLSSLRPTLAIAPATLPAGLIKGTRPADDILIEWKSLAAAAIAKPTSINFPEPSADLDYTDFTIADLKSLAKLRGHNGYSRMSRRNLIALLSA